MTFQLQKLSRLPFYKKFAQVKTVCGSGKQKLAEYEVSPVRQQP